MVDIQKVDIEQGKSVAPTYTEIDAVQSGDSTVIAAPGSGKKIRLLAYTISNHSDSEVDIYFEFGGDGVLRFPTRLVREGGNSNMNLLGANIEGGDNQALTINLSAAKQIRGSVMTVTLDV